MKKFNFRRLLVFLLAILAFFNSVSAQTESANLLENVELKFSLSGDPSPAEVGFDNPKSYWQLEYELFLSDSAELEKLGRCERNEIKQLNCFIQSSKKLDKKIKKISLLINKGKFKQTELSSEPARRVTIPIQLSPAVIETYNQAAKIFEKNPTFVLFIKTKASTKTAAKLKFKRKLVTSRVYPLKTYAVKANDFDFWNVRSLIVGFTIRKGEDGKLRGLGF
ncbi:MAG TPA: hypothetical protein VNB22_21230 [Pyrinomonadaceae bacterium]|nr:hypothetical protein [Pyrinomonadaceae bacterium]